MDVKELIRKAVDLKIEFWNTVLKIESEVAKDQEEVFWADDDIEGLAAGVDSGKNISDATLDEMIANWKKDFNL